MCSVECWMNQGQGQGHSNRMPCELKPHLIVISQMRLSTLCAFPLQPKMAGVKLLAGVIKWVKRLNSTDSLSDP